MININFVILAAGLVVEAKTDDGRMVGGAMLSASPTAALRNVGMET